MPPFAGPGGAEVFHCVEKRDPIFPRNVKTLPDFSTLWKNIFHTVEKFRAAIKRQAGNDDAFVGRGCIPGGIAPPDLECAGTTALSRAATCRGPPSGVVPPHSITAQTAGGRRSVQASQIGIEPASPGLRRAGAIEREGGSSAGRRSVVGPGADLADGDCHPELVEGSGHDPAGGPQGRRRDVSTALDMTGFIPGRRPGLQQDGKAGDKKRTGRGGRSAWLGGGA